MSDTVIKVDNVSKQYRLGEVGTGALKDDIKRWRYRLMGKEDPFLLVG
jgi:lipopolysaccharide transport system ATP-binding protein